MTLITPVELAAWRARLSGQPRPDDGSDHPPDWFAASVLRMHGIEGMHQLSNLGTSESGRTA